MRTPTFLLLLFFLSMYQTGFGQKDSVEYYMAHEQFQKAIHNAEKKIEHACLKNELLANCYFYLGNLPKAIEYYRQCLACGNAVLMHINIGDCFFKLDRGDSAYTHFSIAYNLDPNNPLVNYNLGMLNFTSSYDSDAIFHLRKAIAYSKEIDFDSYELLAEVYTESGKYDSAQLTVKSLVAEATKRKDNVVRARMIEAFTYGDMGRTQQAIDILTDLINAGIKDKVLEQSAYINRYLGYCLTNNKERGCADLKKLKQLGAAAEVENCFTCEEAGK